MASAPIRPSFPFVDPSGIPNELRSLDQWVGWQLQWRTDTWSKIPIDPNRPGCALASSTNPATWSTFETALSFAEKNGLDGVGFVFHESDPYVGIDLDHVRDDSTGAIEPWAVDIIRNLDSYSEISVSGTGVHIIGRGKLPGHGLHPARSQIEIYDQGRYFTFSGRVQDQKLIENRAEEINTFYQRISDQYSRAPKPGAPPQLSNGRGAMLSDAEVIEHAEAASNGDNFRRLMSGDTSGYGGDDSAADAALCEALTFWTGGDRAQIDRIFRSSGLMRPKWDSHQPQPWGTYGNRTIDFVFSGKTSFYTPPIGYMIEATPSTNGHSPTPGQQNPQAIPGRPVEIEDYPLQTLHDLVTMSETTDDQILEGILWSNRVTWVFAAAGAGKSIFLLAALMHVAAGRSFCGRATSEGPVLFIEEDSPLSILAGYVESITDIYEIDLEHIPFWINRLQGLRITDDEGLARAIAAVERCPQKPLVVVIDACERVTPSDSFSTREFDPLVRFLQWLVSNGITAIVIDHIKKPPQLSSAKKADAPPVRPLDQLYGSVAKQQLADVMIYFAGSLKAGLVHASFEKFRGEAPPAFDLSFANDAGFVLKEGKYAPSTPSEKKILSFVNSAPAGETWSPDDICAATNIKERTAFRALTSLVKHRVLIKQGATKQGTRYTANVSYPGPFA